MKLFFRSAALVLVAVLSLEFSAPGVAKVTSPDSPVLAPISAQTSPLIVTTLTGPTVTPPGGFTFTAGPSTGGSTYAGTAQGRTGGQVNTYSAFNFGQFNELYWGAFTDPSATASDVSESGVAVTFDGTATDPAITHATGEVLTYSGSTSNLPAGIARWTGTATLGTAVPTRLTLTITDAEGQPIPFIDATTLGLNTGAVIRVTRNFTVNVLFEAQYATGVWSPAIAGYDGILTNVKTPTSRIWTSFKGGFWYAPGTQVFSDVPSTDFAYSQINAFYQRGITTGCFLDSGTGERRFCPNDNVLRDQMAVFLVRAKGLTQLASGTPTFSDVPTTYWSYGFIERLYEQAVTSGCFFNSTTGERRYCPVDAVSRGQMAAFLMRAKGLTQLANPTPTFADVPTTHPFYGWIERLYAQGVTTGCFYDSGTGVRRFCPEANVTRREMAVFIIRNWP